MFRLCGFLALLVVTGPAFAEQLTFDSKELVFHPSAADMLVTSSFPFTNTGTTAVTIIDATASCGCTTTTLTKKTYAPGEKGEIGFAFTIADRTGEQQKTIKVITDEPSARPTILTMKFLLPIGPIFSSRFPEWDIGDTPMPKSVTITIPKGSDYEIKGVESHDARVHVSLTEESPHQKYEINISIDDLKAPFSRPIDVITNYRIFHIFIRVRSAK
jgi:hypothetical protein